MKLSTSGGQEEMHIQPLRSLDVFAGCGGREVLLFTCNFFTLVHSWLQKRVEYYDFKPVLIVDVLV